MTRRFFIATALELLGLLTVAVGVGLIYLPAGVIAGGLAAAAVGFAAGFDPKGAE